MESLPRRRQRNASSACHLLSLHTALTIECVQSSAQMAIRCFPLAVATVNPVAPVSLSGSKTMNTRPRSILAKIQHTPTAGARWLMPELLHDAQQARYPLELVARGRANVQL